MRGKNVLREKCCLRAENGSVVAPMSVEIDKTPRGADRAAQFPTSRRFGAVPNKHVADGFVAMSRTSVRMISSLANAAVPPAQEENELPAGENERGQNGGSVEGRVGSWGANAI
jgi:hypothetical protein